MVKHRRRHSPHRDSRCLRGEIPRLHGLHKQQVQQEGGMVRLHKPLLRGGTSRDLPLRARKGPHGVAGLRDSRRPWRLRDGRQARLRHVLVPGGQGRRLHEQQRGRLQGPDESEERASQFGQRFQDPVLQLPCELRHEHAGCLEAVAGQVDDRQLQADDARGTRDGRDGQPKSG